MRLGKRFRFGLAPKLALCLGATTAAVILLYASVSLRYQRLESERIAIQDANRFGELIQRSTRYLMLRNDREALNEVLTTIGGQPGTHRIRVFSGTGTIRFSTDPSELGTAVNKDAEACFGCHADGQIPAQLRRSDHARILTDASGERKVGVIRVIENEPACSNATCHAHPAAQHVLGVIDTSLSLAGVDAQLAAQRKRIMRTTLITEVVIVLACIAFAWWVVAKPVRGLIKGTQLLAKGNLDHRLVVHSADELGELANSFNAMAESLARAQQEIKDWGYTLEARVEQKSHELEGAHRTMITREKMASLGKLAATVAHEVNNPLAGILTYAGLSLKQLNKSGCDPAVRAEITENLHTIERESRRCGDLMRNLLTFARQAPSQREPNDLNTLVRHGLALVHHQLELKGIALDENLQTNLQPVRCDAGQIRQVILALLVNAVEAMHDGGQLEISTAIGDSGRGVILRVRDTGMGIPPEALPHIFDPFFTTKDNQQSTGLGLAVAHTILEQHGGEISVNSNPGKGTEFIVTLPLDAQVSVEPILAGQEKR
jgi:two-component system, NtrC family, sensor kinase